MESQLPALISFAKRLAPYLAGNLASALYRINTSVLEGMNNRIKVIKRMAYGLHGLRLHSSSKSRLPFR